MLIILMDIHFMGIYSEIISNYLSRHKPALATMLAEVRSQSADDLVEGLSADEENKYSFTHYYGNR